jgi:thiol:disulfide interchange protein DsbA
MRRLVLVSAVVALGLLAAACEKKSDTASTPAAPPPPTSTPDASGSTSGAPISSIGASSAANWAFGTNYRALAAEQPTNVGSGKVEVVEVFWYACGHCFGLEPFLADWKKSKPDFVEFVKMPVVWQAPHRQHARLFYTIEALKRPELHGKVFEEIHQKGAILAAGSDDEARKMHRDFLRDQGVTAKQFDEAYDSFDVSQKVSRAEQLTKRYEVDAVPRVILNGKFSTDIGMAGGHEKLIALINDISAAEPR